MNNLHFHKLKREGEPNCEHCHRVHERTEEIEGIGPFSFETVCDECWNFEDRLRKLNGIISRSLTQLSYLQNEECEEGFKLNELLRVLRQKRNKVIFEAKQFYETCGEKAGAGTESRLPYKE